jgi:hypothetical protein
LGGHSFGYPEVSRRSVDRKVEISPGIPIGTHSGRVKNTLSGPMEGCDAVILDRMDFPEFVNIELLLVNLSDNKKHLQYLLDFSGNLTNRGRDTKNELYGLVTRGREKRRLFGLLELRLKKCVSFLTLCIFSVTVFAIGIEGECCEPDHSSYGGNHAGHSSVLSKYHAVRHLRFHSSDPNQRDFMSAPLCCAGGLSTDIDHPQLTSNCPRIEFKKLLSDQTNIPLKLITVNSLAPAAHKDPLNLPTIFEYTRSIVLLI